MPMARISDPETSHEAAASVKKITETQKWIMYIFLKREAPITDEMLVAAYRGMMVASGAPYASESGIRSRRAELVRLGHLKDSGLRMKLVSGRNAIMWAVARELA